MRTLSLATIIAFWSAGALAGEIDIIIANLDRQAGGAGAPGALMSYSSESQPARAARRQSNQPAISVEPARQPGAGLSDEARAAMALGDLRFLDGLSPRWSFGFSFGAQFPGDLPINSTQNFYTNGNLNSDAAGGLVGGAIFYDLWTTGSGSTPFSRHTHSIGVVIDAFLGASNRVRGLCGGFPCDGTFNLDQVNAIFEWKYTTSLTDRTTFNFYVGAGPSFASASGQPTGQFGPRAHGDDTALAIRVGGGFGQQLGGGFTFDFKTGYQWTDELEFPTDLAGERFRVGMSGVYYTAVGFTYRPPGDGPQAVLRQQRNIIP
jgi:hypothetical protein